MLPCPSGVTHRRRAVTFCILAVLTCCSGLFRAAAQTPQPWLFVNTIANGKTTGSVTFLRDDSSGALSLLANSQTTFTNPCGPSTIDPKGRYLYGYCADGLSLYTIDAATGAVSEVATSPFQASTGQFGVLVIAESSGQFVYLLKSDLLPTPSTSTLTLDTFQVDPAAPGLVPVGSQQLPVSGAWIDGGAVGDPNGHGVAIFINQFPTSQAQFPIALLYLITFDPDDWSGHTGSERRNGCWQPRAGSAGQRARKLPRAGVRFEPRVPFDLPDRSGEFRVDIPGDGRPGERTCYERVGPDVPALHLFRSHGPSDLCTGAPFRGGELHGVF